MLLPKLTLITQAEMAEAARLQSIAHDAEAAARRSIDGIADRIRQGATIEPGALIFDAIPMMVRNRDEDIDFSSIGDT